MRHALQRRHILQRMLPLSKWLFTKPAMQKVYSDDYIKKILTKTSVIALVGASSNWNRPSYFAMKYMQDKGYKVIPINPILAAKGESVLGEKAYASLEDVPKHLRSKIDMVDVFRRPDEVKGIAKDAIQIGAKTLWTQLGVICNESEAIASEAGLNVVMDRCPKIEYSRLYGELGWHGFDSGVISSKRRSMGQGSKETTADSDTKPVFEGFATKAIHAGASPDPVTGARSTPIYQTTAYVFEDVDQAASLFNLSSFGNIYSRLSNPTTAVLEERIAALENGKGTTATASGHSAQILALFALMSPGDRIVSSDKLYGGSITQFGKTFQKFGWHCSFVDTDSREAVRDALAQPDVKALWTESLANPGGYPQDLEMLADEAHNVGVPLIVDNTMATPFLCKPIEYGADIVVHSTTKFMSGHGNAMGGAVVDSGRFNWSADKGKFPSLSEPEPAYHGLNFHETFGDLAFTTFGHAVGLRDLGPTMAPLNAFLTITGIETLPLRMQKHVDNARVVAEFLQQHERIEWVSYAGFPSSKYYDLSQKYFPNGPGSVFSAGIKGGFDAGTRVVERCQLLSHLANIGDTRSLILHPASTTHRQLTPEQREACGAGDNVLRFSVGIEDAEDLVKDVAYALE